MGKVLLILFYIVGVIGILLSIFKTLLLNNNFKEEQNIIYKKKNFLTNTEKIFYQKLIKIEKYNYKVIPQVNLASIINKNSKYKYQTELYRNIDFAIFDKTLTYPLLLIELNDITHNSNKRRERDKRVKNICEQAGIKLIAFYTKYDNKEEYIINRVLENINTNTNENDQLIK